MGKIQTTPDSRPRVDGGELLLDRLDTIKRNIHLARTKQDVNAFIEWLRSYGIELRAFLDEGAAEDKRYLSLEKLAVDAIEKAFFNDDAKFFADAMIACVDLEIFLNRLERKLNLSMGTM